MFTAAPARHSPEPAERVTASSPQKAWKSETSSAVSVRLRSDAALVRACRQSWRGNRIALPNPAVATGLLPPILR